MPEPTRRHTLRLAAATGIAAAATAVPVRGAAASPHRPSYGRTLNTRDFDRDPNLSRRAHKAIARDNALRLLPRLAKGRP